MVNEFIMNSKDDRHVNIITEKNAIQSTKSAYIFIPLNFVILYFMKKNNVQLTIRNIIIKLYNHQKSFFL